MTDVDDWDDPLWDGYEPDPTDHPDFERHEHERYLRSLSPLRRFLEPLRALVWQHTWKWRIRPDLSGPFSDEPPF